MPDQDKNIQQKDDSQLVAKEPRAAKKRVKIVKLAPDSPNTKSARQAAFKAKCVGVSPAEVMDAARLIPAEEVRRCKVVRVSG